MVSDFYGTLLQELSEALGIDTLEPDEHNTCLIRFINELEVQIEPDKKEDFLLIGTNFGTLPAGPYREELFKAALISNGLPYPCKGTFAYSEKRGELVMYGLLPLKELTGQGVADYLDPFMGEAIKWKEAISSGNVPAIGSFAEGTSKGGGLFGLIK
jgi:hypothetical protein